MHHVKLSSCVFCLLVLCLAPQQDRRVRLYDTTRNWALRKDVTTRMTRWTITGGWADLVVVGGGGRTAEPTCHLCSVVCCVLCAVCWLHTSQPQQLPKVCMLWLTDMRVMSRPTRSQLKAVGRAAMLHARRQGQCVHTQIMLHLTSALLPHCPTALLPCHRHDNESRPAAACVCQHLPCRVCGQRGQQL